MKDRKKEIVLFILLILAGLLAFGCEKEEQVDCSTVRLKAGGRRLAKQVLYLHDGTYHYVTHEQFAIYDRGDIFCY